MLRDLPETVCPECGRLFDPADPSTYNPDPPGSRRRRWVKRSVVVAVIVLLLVGFFPRRLMSGSITFTDIESGDQVVVRRWEPVPPSWIPFRYPGVHWTSGDNENIREAGSTASRRSWDVQVRSDNWIGSCCMGTTRDPGEIVEVNGLETTPSTAPDILTELMSPSRSRISIRSRTPP
jgi:hypothetical protein